MKNFARALLRPRNSGLFDRAMSAGFWAVALRVLVRASLIIRTVILARILTPEDFGLIAIATISIALLERFTHSGIDSALVQRKGDVTGFLNTAWTAQIIRGLLMAAILAVSAPWIAQFFGAPEARLIVQVMSISIVVNGFANIGIVLFIKELRFDKLFVLEGVARGADVVASIVAALILRNAWALVIGVLVGSLVRSLVSYLISKYRPKLHWIWHQFTQLFGFGKWVLATNALNFITAELDDILVGRMLGIQFLGWYRMAYNFSQAIATELTQVTSQVAFPTYSKLQTAIDRLRNAYMGTVHLVAFLGIPMAIGTILIADDLTFGILGDQWAPIIAPMQVLSVAGLVKGIAATAGPLFQSQGRPDLPARFMLANVVVVAVLLYPAISQFELIGAAGVVTLAQLLTGVPAFALALHSVHATRPGILQALCFPALNTGIMAAAVAAARLVFFDGPSAVSFFLLVGVGILAYFGAVFLSTKILGYVAPADLLHRIRGAAA